MEEEFIADFCAFTKHGRLDSLLSQCFPQFSRSLLQEWIRQGDIRVNARSIKPSHTVRRKEEIRIRARAPLRTQDRAEPMNLSVVYEDPHLMVINKPAGLTVHPGAGTPAGTLLNALLSYDPRQRCLPRAGLAHRLDKGTSGLILVAKKRETLLGLQRSLKTHSIRRRYAALVEGVPIAGDGIRDPIARDPRNRLRFRAYTTAAAPAGARAAITHYRIEQKYVRHSLLNILLKTGRTHQIRCHLAAHGHPLVGDRLYGAEGCFPPQCSEPLRRSLRQFKRQALHAAALRFIHPHNGREMNITAPMPHDMRRLLDLLRE